MLRIDLIKSILTARIFAVVSLLVTLLMTVFFVLLLKASITTYQAYLTGNMISPALGIPMYYIYAGAVIGFAIAVFRSIQSLIVRDIPSALGKGPKTSTSDKGE